MILRRISQGIRQQDWLVVGVEILTVVIGIFIGLQVDDWNEARKEAQEENNYLQRLLVDMDRSLELQRREVEVASWHLDRIENVIRMLEGDPDISVEEFEESLYAGGVTRSLRLVQGTMNELVSSGQLATISDQSIRDAVLGLIEAFERAEKTLERINVRFEPFKVEYHRYFIERQFNPLNKPPLDYDLDKLKQDRNFLLICHNIHNMLGNYKRFHTGAYERTFTFRNQLATTLNLPVLPEALE